MHQAWTHRVAFVLTCLAFAVQSRRIDISFQQVRGSRATQPKNQASSKRPNDKGDLNPRRAVALLLVTSNLADAFNPSSLGSQFSVGSSLSTVSRQLIRPRPQNSRRHRSSPQLSSSGDKPPPEPDQEQGFILLPGESAVSRRLEDLADSLGKDRKAEPEASPLDGRDLPTSSERGNQTSPASSERRNEWVPASPEQRNISALATPERGNKSSLASPEQGNKSALASSEQGNKSAALPVPLRLRFPDVPKKGLLALLLVVMAAGALEVAHELPRPSSALPFLLGLGARIVARGEWIAARVELWVAGFLIPWLAPGLRHVADKARLLRDTYDTLPSPISTLPEVVPWLAWGNVAAGANRAHAPFDIVLPARMEAAIRSPPEIGILAPLAWLLAPVGRAVGAVVGPACSSLELWYLSSLIPHFARVAASANDIYNRLEIWFLGSLAPVLCPLVSLVSAGINTMELWVVCHFKLVLALLSAGSIGLLSGAFLWALHKYKVRRTSEAINTMAWIGQANVEELNEFVSSFQKTKQLQRLPPPPEPVIDAVGDVAAQFSESAANRGAGDAFWRTVDEVKSTMLDLGSVVMANPKTEYGQERLKNASQHAAQAWSEFVNFSSKISEAANETASSAATRKLWPALEHKGRRALEFLERFPEEVRRDRQRQRLVPLRREIRLLKLNHRPLETLTHADVKNAYMELARNRHPDLARNQRTAGQGRDNGYNATASQEEYQEVDFQAYNEARTKIEEALTAVSQ